MRDKDGSISALAEKSDVLRQEIINLKLQVDSLTQRIVDLEVCMETRDSGVEKTERDKISKFDSKYLLGIAVKVEKRTVEWADAETR